MERGQQNQPDGRGEKAESWAALPLGCPSAPQPSRVDLLETFFTGTKQEIDVRTQQSFPHQGPCPAAEALGGVQSASRGSHHSMSS